MTESLSFTVKIQLLRLQAHWKASLLHSAIVWPVRFNSGHIHTGQNLQLVKDTLKSWDAGGCWEGDFEFVFSFSFFFLLNGSDSRQYLHRWMWEDIESLPLV
jgi:hypothetical protein